MTTTFQRLSGEEASWLAPHLEAGRALHGARIAWEDVSPAGTKPGWLLIGTTAQRDKAEEIIAIHYKKKIG